MHEVSICQSIIDSLENEFGEDQLPFIRGINLKVGVLSCVEPVVLKHVFSMMVADSAMPQAELQIEIVDVQAECKQCGNVEMSLKSTGILSSAQPAADPLPTLLRATNCRSQKLF
jgi:hydrogenase nickel incorporation protein HypA/HybF